MILYCKEISKIAALISEQESADIKDYLRTAVTHFCTDYYDQLYYDRWFSLKTLFCNDDFYKLKPLCAVYDYYVKIGKTETDAEIFSLLDLNCFLDELLATDGKTFSKQKNGKFNLPSYMMIGF